MTTGKMRRVCPECGGTPPDDHRTGCQTAAVVKRELERKLDPRRFTAMSGKLAGLLAYILDTDRWTTEPRIVEACYDSGGIIMVRVEGSVGMEWFGGTADELQSNLTRLFRVAELTKDERALFAKLGKQRVTDWRRKAVTA